MFLSGVVLASLSFVGSVVAHQRGERAISNILFFETLVFTWMAVGGGLVSDQVLIWTSLIGLVAVNTWLLAFSWKLRKTAE